MNAAPSHTTTSITTVHIGRIHTGQHHHDSPLHSARARLADMQKMAKNVLQLNEVLSEVESTTGRDLGTRNLFGQQRVEDGFRTAGSGCLLKGECFFSITHENAQCCSKCAKILVFSQLTNRRRGPPLTLERRTSPKKIFGKGICFCEVSSVSVLQLSVVCNIYNSWRQRIARQASLDSHWFSASSGATSFCLAQSVLARQSQREEPPVPGLSRSVRLLPLQITLTGLHVHNLLHILPGLISQKLVFERT